MMQIGHAQQKSQSDKAPTARPRSALSLVCWALMLQLVGCMHPIAAAPGIFDRPGRLTQRDTLRLRQKVVAAAQKLAASQNTFFAARGLLFARGNLGFIRAAFWQAQAPLAIMPKKPHPKASLKSYTLKPKDLAPKRKGLPQSGDLVLLGTPNNIVAIGLVEAVAGKDRIAILVDLGQGPKRLAWNARSKGAAMPTPILLGCESDRNRDRSENKNKTNKDVGCSNKQEKPAAAWVQGYLNPFD